MTKSERQLGGEGHLRSAGGPGSGPHPGGGKGKSQMSKTKLGFTRPTKPGMGGGRTQGGHGHDTGGRGTDRSAPGYNSNRGY